MKNLFLVENPLVKRDVTILRDKNTNQNEFRLAMDRVSHSIAIEISKSFELTEFDVETPLELTKGYKFKKQIVLIPVLRAGLVLSRLNFSVI